MNYRHGPEKQIKKWFENTGKGHKLKVVHGCKLSHDLWTQCETWIRFYLFASFL